MDYRQPADRAVRIAENMAVLSSGHPIEIRLDGRNLHFFVADSRIGTERFSDTDSALAIGRLIKQYCTSEPAEGKSGVEYIFREGAQGQTAHGRAAFDTGPTLHTISRKAEGPR